MPVRAQATCLTKSAARCAAELSGRPVVWQDDGIENGYLKVSGMAKIDVELTRDMETYLDKQVASGRFSDREDVVKHILRQIIDAGDKAKGGAKKGGGPGRVTIQMRRDDIG